MKQEDHEWELTYTLKLRGYGKRDQVVKSTEELLGVFVDVQLSDSKFKLSKAKIVDGRAAADS